jgi:hypothetical protein
MGMISNAKSKKEGALVLIRAFGDALSPKPARSRENPNAGQIQTSTSTFWKITFRTVL